MWLHETKIQWKTVNEGSYLKTRNGCSVKQKVGYLYKYYSDRKKKREKVFCSNFMSFSPMELIFIGWVGDIYNFCWVLRNFDFKPANEIFSKKGKFSIFQKVCFLGVWHRKLSLSKIGVMDVSYIMDSGQNGLYTTFPNIF